MNKYIDADKLTAQIKGIIAAVETKKHPDVLGSMEQCLAASEVEALSLALDCIKELQQEQPKVDFEEEWDKFEDWMESYNRGDYPTCYSPKQIARHFYELGLNARKED